MKIWLQTLSSYSTGSDETRLTQIRDLDLLSKQKDFGFLETTNVVLSQNWDKLFYPKIVGKKILM